MNRGIRYLILICSFLVFLSLPGYSFELKGLQPVQPDGGFSGFSAATSGKGVFSAGIDLEKAIDVDYYRTTAKAGYGITSRMDVLISYPYIFDWDEKLDGSEDVNIGIKQNLFRENKYAPSVAYLLKVALSTGKREFSTDGSAGAGIILSKKLGPFSSHLNLIYSEPFDDDFENQFEIILSVALRAAHDFDVIAELYALNSYFNDEFDTVEGRLGYRIKTTENIYTVLGAGHDFKNDDPTFRLMVSFNFIFDGQNSVPDSR